MNIIKFSADELTPAKDEIIRLNNESIEKVTKATQIVQTHQKRYFHFGSECGFFGMSNAIDSEFGEFQVQMKSIAEETGQDITVFDTVLNQISFTVTKYKSNPDRYSILDN